MADVPLWTRSSFGFAPSMPLRTLRPHTSAARPCICMKTKRGSAASEKRPAKNKRTSNAGAGFAEKQSSKSREVLSKAVEEEPESSEERAVEVVEETSGAAGDATPHRVQVTGPVSAQMESPEADPLDGPDRALVELPTVTPEMRMELRLDRSLTLDKLIERFADAHEGEQFSATVVANRDLVTERLLYRFTSAIFQVETRENDKESREEEVRNMRALRQDLIAHCWSYDYELKVGVQEAEARLLSVLQGSNVKRDVARNCGRTTIQVDCFWIVIFAAVAAWEERGRENPELANVDMQKALAAAADACESADEVMTRLSPSLKAVQKILTSSDPEVQKEVVSQLDDDAVAELGAFTEQVRLLPIAAYGALCTRMGSILEYVLSDKYGIVWGPLEPFRFELPPVERGSKLVDFSTKSRKLNKQRIG